MVYQYHQGRSRLKAFGLGAAALALLVAVPWFVYRGDELRLIGFRDSSDTLQKIYDSALDTGWQAAVAVQTAQTRQEWEAVAEQWDQAIVLLQTVKRESGDVDGQITQKQTEYEQYRDYALRQTAQHPPDYRWERVTELAGDRSYILVDPDTTDAELEGPPLLLGADHIPQNVDYISDVLVSLGLPPIASQSQLQILNDNQYQVSGYPTGDLVLHRTLCSQSFVISDKYHCLWKITLR
jgi:hypothetical protein